MTFLRDRKTAPLARVEVTIIGSISGVRPTATESANSRASIQSCFVKPLMKNTSGAMTSMKRINSQLTLFTPVWKDVGARSSVVTLVASVPK